MRYWFVFYQLDTGKILCNVPSFVGVRKVAVLDIKDMTCTWMDWSVKDFIAKGLPIMVGYYEECLESVMAEHSDISFDLDWVSERRVCVNAMSFLINVDEGCLKVGGQCLFSVDVADYLAYNIGYLGFSGHDIWRLVIDAVSFHQEDVERVLVSVWFDSVRGRFLGYQVGAGELKPWIGLSGCDLDNWRSFVVYKAKASLFGSTRIL